MKHVAALADPALRGRESGTPDETRAADYVMGEFARLGLSASRQPFPYTHHDGSSRNSANLIAVLPGEDDSRFVLLGAHYDHLGVDAAGAIYRGADDNASGVAGLLGVAAAFTARGGKPKHTILFVAFGAEEQWLKGSAWFAAHPPRPLDRMIVMVNLDMIGRSPFLDSRDYRLEKALAGIAIGPAVGILDQPEHERLIAYARAACAADKLTTYAAEDFPRLEAAVRAEVQERGDHASFGDRGLPFLWFSTSMNDDYHRPTDTPDKIDAHTLRRVAQCVYRTMDTIDRKER